MKVYWLLHKRKTEAIFVKKKSGFLIKTKCNEKSRVKGPAFMLVLTGW